MNYNIVYKILKYTAQFLAIFIILRFLPQITNNSIPEMKICDIIIITSIIMLCYLLFDILCNQNNNVTEESSAYCNSVCSVNENMTGETNKNLSYDDIKDLVNQQVEKRLLGEKNKIKYTKSSKHIDMAKPELIKENIRNASLMNSEKNEQIQYNKNVEKGAYQNDMRYSDYNHIPLAEGHDSTDYEYGYSFMPPSKWAPDNIYPPVCVTDYMNIVSPTNTTGLYTDLKEWKASRKFLPPDRINTAYVKKLNSGE
jgi:hypothetical protein